MKNPNIFTENTEIWAAWLEGKNHSRVGEMVEFETKAGSASDAAHVSYVARAAASALNVDVCEKLNIRRVWPRSGVTIKNPGNIMKNPNEFWQEVAFALILGSVAGYVLAQYF